MRALTPEFDLRVALKLHVCLEIVFSVGREASQHAGHNLECLRKIRFCFREESLQLRGMVIHIFPF